MNGEEIAGSHDDAMGKGVVILLSGVLFLVCGLISDCAGAGNANVARLSATHATR